MISIDAETLLFEEGYQAPHPVCAVVCWGEADEIRIATTRELEEVVHGVLDSGDVIVNVSVSFDMAVFAKHIRGAAPKIWKAYEEDRIVGLGEWDKCAQIEQRAGMKSPSLENLCRAYGVEVLKDQEARLTYGLYYDAPIEEYSPDHVAYLLGDGYAPWKLGQRFLERFGDLWTDAAMLSRKQFWLQLMRNRGMKTDQTAVGALRVKAEAELELLRAVAQTPIPLPGETIDYSAPDKVLDQVRVVRADGTKNMKRLRAWVSHAYDGQPPMTVEAKKRTSAKPFVPQVQTSKEVLGDSGDPYLEVIRDYGEWAAVVNKDLSENMLGRDILHTRFWIADTLRSTSSAPNLQNFRRAAGIRECVVPREGYVLVAADHSGAELAAAAQNAYTYLGRSHMRDLLNNDVDLHIHVGCAVHGNISYDELAGRIAAGAYQQIGGGGDIGPEEYGALATSARRHAFRPYSEFRQFAKIPNFGCLGGMSYPPSLAVYARRQGIPMTVEEAEHVLGAWREATPDGQALLDYVKFELPRWGNGFEVPIPGSGLTRKGAPFCAAANTLFQGRIAVLEAAVGWELIKACHDSDHILGQDCHGVNFVHDEFIFEVPTDWVTPAALAIQEIMVGPVARQYLPDVKLGSEVTAMTRWSKGAKSKWINGELTIWS